MHIGEWCLREETGRGLTSLSVFSLHRPTSPSQETTSSIVQVSTSFRRCSNASRASKPSCHRGTYNASETAGDGKKKRFWEEGCRTPRMGSKLSRCCAKGTDYFFLVTCNGRSSGKIGCGFGPTFDGTRQMRAHNALACYGASCGTTVVSYLTTVRRPRLV